MTKTKHALGPFDVFKRDITASDGERRVIIAQVKKLYVGPLAGQDLAIAQLMAAAPDMLAACKALLEIVEFDYALHIDNAYWPTVRPVYEQAKAAVAKAYLRED